MDNFAWFDVNLCYDCNFRCAYCYEQSSTRGYTAEAMDEATAARYVEYLKYMRQALPAGTGVSVQFYGGEPMLHFDRLAQICAGARDAADVFCIVTNGSLVETYKNRLFNLKGACGGKLRTSVSYDFCFQNTNRQADTYDTVRDAIRTLHAQDMMRKVITVFDQNTLARMDEAFADFIALREECPGLVCGFNLALSGDLSGFDEAAATAALENIRTYLRAHPEHTGSFFHNTFGPHNHWRNEHCILTGVVSCVDTDGGLYPEYTTLYQGEDLRTLLHYGNISEDFAALCTKQDAVISGLDLSVPDNCGTCTATCKMPLYSRYVSPEYRYTLASEESCRIRNLVHSYLGDFR